MQERIDDIFTSQQEWNKKQLFMTEDYQEYGIRQHKEKQIYQRYIDKLLKINELHQILISRIESKSKRNNPQKQDDEDSFSETRLTTQDGAANRTIGHQQQEEFAQFFCVVLVLRS